MSINFSSRWDLFRGVVNLFCCPPLPSSIASKLAFLPPPASYEFVGSDEWLATGSGDQPTMSGRMLINFKDSGLWPYDHLQLMEPRSYRQGSGTSSLLESIGAGELVATARCGDELNSLPNSLQCLESFYVRTKHDARIACVFIRCRPPDQAHYTILYSHGNAVDVGHMCHFLYNLGCELNCNVLCYDYSGYGLSSGRPSERNLYADIEAAWKALLTRYGITPTSVILYGQSIGTVPTVDLASRYECAAVILHSPLMSGLKVACPSVRRTWFFDAFKNIEKVQRISAKVLVIHGMDDEVIDISHGMEIYSRCPNTTMPLWVEGAGHNDIEYQLAYVNRLREFLAELLSTGQAARPAAGDEPSAAGVASGGGGAERRSPELTQRHSIPRLFASPSSC